jgi:hypothetical protein
MSHLFTKAAKVKTTSKLWIIGIALLIMVNIPYVDNHYQPTPSVAPIYSPSVAVQPSSPTVAAPNTRSQKVIDTPVQPNPQPSLLSSVAGDYTGSVHNETAALSANFAIKVHDFSGNLSGFMSVKPPLYGSGPLEGSANGADVSFTVTSSIGKIAFIGTRSKQRITGTYTVTQPTGALENGTFTLNRVPPVSRADVAVAKEEPTAAVAILPDARLPEPAPSSVTTPTVTPRVLEHSDPKNLSNCMYGMPSCDHRPLTATEESAVAESARKRNLSNCMYGMPNCDHRPLTEAEQAAVAESARRRNLSNCMYGMPSCDHRPLTTTEETAVAESARKRNLSNCMYGMPNCDRRTLTEAEQAAVAESARKRNLSNCLYGVLSCNRTLLTPQELIRVQDKDNQRQH